METGQPRETVRQRIRETMQVVKCVSYVLVAGLFEMVAWIELLNSLLLIYVAEWWSAMEFDLDIATGMINTMETPSNH